MAQNKKETAVYRRCLLLGVKFYDNFPCAGDRAQYYKKISQKSVIVVSFSNSLYRDKYIKLFTQLFDISILQFLDIKNITGATHIILQENVTWDICRLNIPIVYFADDYRLLLDNYYWFTNRNEEDIIFDKNGNLMYGSDSLKTNS